MSEAEQTLSVTVTEELREDLETALNLIVTLANIQMHDDAYQDLVDLTRRLANTFEIPCEFVDVSVDDATGEIRINVEESTPDPQEDTPQPDDTVH